MRLHELENLGRFLLMKTAGRLSDSEFACLAEDSFRKLGAFMPSAAKALSTIKGAKSVGRSQSAAGTHAAYRKPERFKSRSADMPALTQTQAASENISNAVKYTESMDRVNFVRP